MQWYLGAFKKYAVFQGRARRKEFWMFYLFNMIVTFVLSGIASSIAISGAAADGTMSVGATVVYIILGVYSLVILLPALGLAVRRLHDIGKGGGWIFISLVPAIGSIWLLVLMCTNSVPGDNAYGPNPKEYQ